MAPYRKESSKRQFLPGYVPCLKSFIGVRTPGLCLPEDVEYFLVRKGSLTSLSSLDRLEWSLGLR